MIILNYMKLLVRHRTYLFILIGSLILLFTILLRYYSSGMLIGDVGYFHLRIAEKFANEGFFRLDELSYGGRLAFYGFGWSIILSFFSILIGFKNASFFVPFVFGILSIIFYYLILRKLNFKEETINLSLLILAISPTFLYLFGTSSSYLALILFSLIGFYLFLKNNKFSLIFFALLPFFSLFGSFLVIFLLAFYVFIFDKDKRNLFLYILILVIVINSLLWGVRLFTTSYLPNEILLNAKINLTMSFYDRFFSDLGGFGFGIFSAILFFVGMSLLWKRKYKYLSFYILFMGLILLSFISDWGIYFLNFFVCVIVTMGLMKLIKMKREIRLIRNLTIWILIIGLIFSGLSFINRMSTMDPNFEVFECMNFLREKSEPDSTVFSHFSRGNWITYMASRKNVMDSTFFYAPNLDRRFVDSGEMLYSNEDLELFKEYGVDYVYLDDKLKGDLFGNEEVGLLYSLSYSKNFKKVFSNGYCEVWKFGG